MKGCHVSKRTIEPVRVVLPAAEGGYYRFGDLPRLIADCLHPEQPDADEHEQELQWMRHSVAERDHLPRDLKQAAGLLESAPGYLHVVENSPLKQPLEWREGAILESGLVHVDWLNDWGQSRKPPMVFTAGTQPQDDSPHGPVPAPDRQDWTLRQPQRYGPYAAPLYRVLTAAREAQKPCPKARDVLEVWREALPPEIAQVLPGEVHYYDANGNVKTANLAAIQKAIDRLTKPD